MEEILERVCGLDVHKNSIVACVRTANRKGKPACKEIKTFPTHLRGLKQMSD
jgi:hypothetical protein